MTEDVFPLQHKIFSIAMEVFPKGNKVVQLLVISYVRDEKNIFLGYFVWYINDVPFWGGSYT